MSEATIEATTVEAALEKAAAELGVAAGELDHEVVEEKREAQSGLPSPCRHFFKSSSILR